MGKHELGKTRWLLLLFRPSRLSVQHCSLQCCLLARPVAAVPAIAAQFELSVAKQAQWHEAYPQSPYSVTLQFNKQMHCSRPAAISPLHRLASIMPVMKILQQHQSIFGLILIKPPWPAQPYQKQQPGPSESSPRVSLSHHPAVTTQRTEPSRSASQQAHWQPTQQQKTVMLIPAREALPAPTQSMKAICQINIWNPTHLVQTCTYMSEPCTYVL